MNKEKLIFAMFKDAKCKGRKHLRCLIRNQFKDITDKELDDITLKIYNYQVDTYGGSLVELPNQKTIDELNVIKRRAKQRKYDKKKYYRNLGRM